jgi:predicted alpha/beta hydrolase family esterase
MRTADADILIIPGLGGSGPEHWQSRWEAKLSSARRVIQADWDNPRLDVWCERIAEEVECAGGPVVLVAHSLGVLAAIHAAPLLEKGASAGKIKGGFLAAPPSRDLLAHFDTVDPEFLTRPAVPLPFPALVIASQNDPYSSFAGSAELASALGAELADAGFSGHINVESGHGPWPEGLLRFAGFLRTL